MEDLEATVRHVLGLLNPRFELLSKGRERQKTVWENREADYLPLLITNMPVEEKDDCPSFDKKEQFYDKRKMLIQQAWGLVSTARGQSDAQLSAPVDLGAGFIPSILGLQQMVFEDKDPWLKESLSKEQIARLRADDVGDISAEGLVPKALEYTRYFRETLGAKAHVCLCGDMFWGPFSLAHLIRRDEIFTDLHDDPPFVHHLMEIATELYIQAVRIVKEAAGEPLTSGYRRELYIGAGGVVVNEDTMILVSPSHAEQFVYPYLRKALASFGGGLVHFCGDGSHLLDSLLDIPEVKGINFGDPQHYVYEEVIQGVLRRGKFYQGAWWPERGGKDTESYFRRLLEPLGGARRGLILTYGLTTDEQETPERVMDLWHTTQDAPARE